MCVFSFSHVTHDEFIMTSLLGIQFQYNFYDKAKFDEELRLVTKVLVTNTCSTKCVQIWYVCYLYDYHCNYFLTSKVIVGECYK